MRRAVRRSALSVVRPVGSHVGAALRARAVKVTAASVRLSAQGGAVVRRTAVAGPAAHAPEPRAARAARFA